MRDIKSRILAMSLHAAISAVVFVATAILMIYVYFPSVHFRINGGWQGLRLMFVIDLILGPTLTFFVYNKLKPRREKIIDLSCVASVQVLALIYGFYTVYQDHPVLLIAYPGAVIETVSKHGYEENIVDADLKDFPLLTGLPFVAYDPERKKENFGLVSVDYQRANIERAQSLLLNQLDEQKKNRLEVLKAQHHADDYYIMQLVGSFETDWLLLTDKFAYVGSLGKEPTGESPFAVKK